MIVAAGLCAVVIITFDLRAQRGARERLVRYLAWAVIAGSLLVVVSAYERVRFYEAAYGYTEERLYVQACCGAVAMALVLLAWELRSSIELPRLTRHVARMAVLCVCALAYWNHVAWIVQANLERYERTGKLDVGYLQALAQQSPDAVPTLVLSLPTLRPEAAQAVRSALRRASAGYPGELSWYEWSLSRAAARSALRAAHLLDGADTHAPEAMADTRADPQASLQQREAPDRESLR